VSSLGCWCSALSRLPWSLLRNGLSPAFNTAMNIFSHLARIYFRPKPVGFRKGAEGLVALVRETMTADPFSGRSTCSGPSVRIGSSRSSGDGTGLCLYVHSYYTSFSFS
jgi:hypothetical protein